MEYCDSKKYHFEDGNIVPNRHQVSKESCLKERRFLNSYVEYYGELPDDRLNDVLSKSPDLVVLNPAYSWVNQFFSV